MLMILEWQAKDQLPGGRYHEPSQKAHNSVKSDVCVEKL